MMELPDETLRVVREVVELFSLLDSSYRQSEVRCAIIFFSF
jgi:hypothetical protein